MPAGSTGAGPAGPKAPGDVRAGGPAFIGSQDFIPGDSTRVDQFRVRSFAFPESHPEIPTRTLQRQFTPVYPLSERAFRRNYECRVFARVDSAGRVVAAESWGRRGGGPGSDSCEAFDSASVRAARAWTWAPGQSSRLPQTLVFNYTARAVNPRGEGSVLVVAVEAISRDTIDAGCVGIAGPAREFGTISFGKWGTRLRDLPAGSTHLLVECCGNFSEQRADVEVRPGAEDTVVVVMTPRESVPAGHTYWTQPPAAHPSRPEDDQKYPLGGFGFRFETDRGELVDSVHGVVTKDLVIGPDTTISLALTNEELDRVRRKMIEVRLWDMPEPHPPDLGDRMSMPHTTVRLEATAGGLTRRLTWNTGTDLMDYPSDSSKRLMDLWHVIRSVVEEHPEYKALPDIRGLYQ